LGGAREDVRLYVREGAQMRPVVLSRPEHSAFRRFVETVLALSDDPRPENVARYLAASRALEHSRSSRKLRQSRAA
jgi:hypothetical protein